MTGDERPYATAAADYAAQAKAMQDAAQQAAAAFDGFPAHNHHAKAVTPAQRAAKRARGKAARQARATHRRK